MTTRRPTIELGARLPGPKWGRRLLVVGATATVGMSFLVGRLVEIQVADAHNLSLLARANQVRRIPIEADRGVIFDRHGVQLVMNEPSWSLEVVPGNLASNPAQHQAEIAKLATWSGRSSADVENLIDGSTDSFSPLVVQSAVSATESEVIQQELPTLPGVELDQRPVRTYLDPLAFAHLIGYTGSIQPADLAALRSRGYQPDEQVGRAGVEAGLESLLRGRDGWKDVEVDAEGRPGRVLDTEAPLAGRDVHLSIDANLQLAVDHYLGDELHAVGRRSGAAIVLDPRTGELLAMASQPGYDDNLFTHGITAGELAQLEGDPSRPLFDTALSGEFAPGSTFKMITAAAGLQEGRITPATQLDCPSSIDYGGWTYHNWAGGDMGTMSVAHAIAVSCDTFFYAVADRLGDRTLARYARAFGYGAAPDIQMPGAATGVAPDRDWKAQNCAPIFGGRDCGWHPGDTLTMGIGQSFVLATPLIQAMYLGAIANGGSLLAPSVVASVGPQAASAGWRPQPRLVSRVPVSPSNLEVVREGMRECLEAPFGTGFMFRAARFAESGGCKTGSAQFAGNSALHAWFMFFAPYRNPEIAVVVFVDGGGEGHQVAEPVALNIANWYFTHRPAVRA